MIELYERFERLCLPAKFEFIFETGILGSFSMLYVVLLALSYKNINSIGFKLLIMLGFLFGWTYLINYICRHSSEHIGWLILILIYIGNLIFIGGSLLITKNVSPVTIFSAALTLFIITVAFISMEIDNHNKNKENKKEER